MPSSLKNIRLTLVVQIFRKREMNLSQEVLSFMVEGVRGGFLGLVVRLLLLVAVAVDKGERVILENMPDKLKFG